MARGGRIISPVRARGPQGWGKMGSKEKCEKLAKKAKGEIFMQNEEYLNFCAEECEAILAAEESFERSKTGLGSEFDEFISDLGPNEEIPEPDDADCPPDTDTLEETERANQQAFDAMTVQELEALEALSYAYNWR